MSHDIWGKSLSDGEARAFLQCSRNSREDSMTRTESVRRVRVAEVREVTGPDHRPSLWPLSEIKSHGEVLSREVTKVTDV